MRGISVVGVVRTDLQQAVLDAIGSLPQSIVHAVEQAGYRVIVALTLTTAIPRLTGQHPPGYPPNATWNHADGGTFAGKIIAIAQQRDLYGLPGVVIDTSTQRAAALVRHEYGHALDIIYQFSQKEDFIQAYFDDVSAIQSNADKWHSVMDELEYCLQAAETGRAETFAEIFAELQGGGTATALRLIEAFPKTAALIESWLKTWQ
jgi:hypothetical protein